MIPEHFDPEKVGEIYRVPYEKLAREARRWREQHAVAPSSRDAFRIGLLLVDVQNTFCIPEFELFVAGRSGMAAVDDNKRLCRFIYENLDRITRIHATLDTHKAMQIFHSGFLVDAAGEHPEPMTVVTLDDVTSGRWKVSPRAADSIPGCDQEYLEQYCRSLSREGKYSLMVWPYHAMLGGVGHALVSSVEEAVFFHNIVRGAQTAFEIKGDHPLTESYSALRPELSTQSGGLAPPKDDAFVEELLAYDALIVTGQAKSHCVAWTVADLLAEIEKRDPALARKVYLLEDATSPVVAPGVADFTDAADAVFLEFERAGMHRVLCTEPIDAWPELPATLEKERR